MNFDDKFHQLAKSFHFWLFSKNRRGPELLLSGFPLRPGPFWNPVKVWGLVWGGLPVPYTWQCLPFPCSHCLWGPLWCGGPSACPVIPLPIHFPQLPQNQHRVRGRLGLDAGSGVLCCTPQEYQKAGNLHFNNSLIMYLSDLVNILHFLNFADCSCCGLSGR